LQEQTDRVGARTISRGMQFALFLVALAWAAAANAVASRAAAGLVGRIPKLGVAEALLDSLFLLFLAVVGFRGLDWIATRGLYQAETFPLPARPGCLTEWSIGAAIGWGLCLAAALPVLVSGHLHGRLDLQETSWLAVVVGIAVLLVISLTEEVIFRGYAFRRLGAAIGPAWAAVAISILFGTLLVQANPPHNTLVALVDCTLFGLLLAMAWMRTHALWLGWGLHFAYRAVAAVVLGLPIAGHGEFGSPTEMYVSGPRWLSGGAFGLDAALLTGVVMLGAMIVLYIETKDYAWKYTHPPIVAGGYEVTVAPPSAHAAMEAAAPPPPLVQILPSTPQTRSVIDVPPPPLP
jgi:membrane protease YdiL (CAAX protease family)